MKKLVLADISYNRATLKVGTRDRYIGWDDALKRQYLDQVVCNNRLLILPWVRVQNLASHLLSRIYNFSGEIGFACMASRLSWPRHSWTGLAMQEPAIKQQDGKRLVKPKA